MSFESYAKHIIDKHRLAVALAVLREKPEHVTMENYLQHLRDRFNTNIDEDNDITVCSDDFNYDDDVINDNNDRAESLNDTNASENFDNDTIRYNAGPNFVINESVNNENNDHNSVSILENFIINDNTISNYNNNETVDQITNTQESVSILKDVMIKTDFCVETRGVVENIAREKNIGSLKIFDSQQLLTQNLIESQDVDATYWNTQTEQNAQNYNSNISNVNCTDKDIHKNTNTQATTQNYTHVSQSQNNSNIIIIKDNLFKSKATLDSINANDNTKLRKNVFDNQNINVTNQNIQEVNKNYNNDHFTYSGEDNRILINGSEINNTINNEHNNLKTQNDIERIENNEMQIDSNEKYDTLNLQISEANSLRANDKINDFPNDMTEETLESEYVDTKISTVTEDAVESNEGTGREELISFKVIEELNRVKCYLNRTNDRRLSGDGSLDSGYRSDNQSRGSYRSSSQQNGSFLNQSGRCLFDYIINAQIVKNNQDITEEITQVLGNLIDKLHEEEKYLLFLDQVLEKVENLLQDIISNNTSDNALLERDEDIHRLFLLNTSPHIQKYTIQKIITYLEALQPRLCNKEQLYEISNTEEMENLCYIFHILEVLLGRYVNSDDVATPKSTQTELKKSTICDMWRKKFYPAHRTNSEIKLEISSPKEFILKKCAEVLNKFIVSCMDGYSLLSYAALQCFNLLQK